MVHVPTISTSMLFVICCWLHISWHIHFKCHSTQQVCVSARARANEHSFVSCVFPKRWVSASRLYLLSRMCVSHFSPMMINANNSCNIKSFKAFHTKSSPRSSFALHTLCYLSFSRLDHLCLSFDTKRNEKRQCHPSLALVGLAMGTLTDICKLKQAQSKWMCANRRQFDSRASEWDKTRQTNNEMKKTSSSAESFTSLTEKLVELYQRKAFINHVLCTNHTH